MDTDPLLTMQEAAREMGKKPTTIRSAITRNNLPFEYKNGNKAVRRSVIAGYYESLEFGRPRKSKQGAVPDDK